MAFAPGKSSICLQDILDRITEADIAAHYLGITTIPSIINSPLRQDNHPSMGIYSPNGVEVNYIDFSTKEGGRLLTLLKKIWNVSYEDTLVKIYNDLSNNNQSNISVKKINTNINKVGTSCIDIKCKVRNWEKHDIEYWASYGIPIKWLKYAEVYPISHKIVVKKDREYIFGADKYAYAYVEHKENKVTLKIYQPFNKNGFKWTNKHDKSVISLWTKVPNNGNKICICSSLKDALCLWANTGIPALAIQGEGYPISNTAINELKRRFTKIYILLDNDEAGLKDGKSLAESTGFTNIVIPQFNEGKDISDLYKAKGREAFLKIILPLFV
jgi:hypothetical protein